MYPKSDTSKSFLDNVKSVLKTKIFSVQGSYKSALFYSIGIGSSEGSSVATAITIDDSSNDMNTKNIKESKNHNKEIGPKLFSRLCVLDSSVSKSIYYDRRSNWNIDGLRRDIELSQKKGKTLFINLKKMNPTAKESDYLNIDGDWRSSSIEDEIRLLNQQAKILFTKLLKLDSKSDKDDYFDPETQNWDIIAIREDIRLTRMEKKTHIPESIEINQQSTSNISKNRNVSKSKENESIEIELKSQIQKQVLNAENQKYPKKSNNLDTKICHVLIDEKSVASSAIHKAQIARNTGIPPVTKSLKKIIILPKTDTHITSIKKSEKTSISLPENTVSNGQKLFDELVKIDPSARIHKTQFLHYNGHDWNISALNAAYERSKSNLNATKNVNRLSQPSNAPLSSLNEKDNYVVLNDGKSADDPTYNRETMTQPESIGIISEPDTDIAAISFASFMEGVKLLDELSEVNEKLAVKEQFFSPTNG